MCLTNGGTAVVGKPITFDAADQDRSDGPRTAQAITWITRVARPCDRLTAGGPGGIRLR